MIQSLRSIWCFTIVTTCLSFFPGYTMGTSNIDPFNENLRYGYGENIGWADLKPSRTDGVFIGDTLVTGFIWCENIGWVRLDPVHGGIHSDGIGNLSGWAWSENGGWISLSCSTSGNCSNAPYGVAIDPGTGLLSGYAWGENLGWIFFGSGNSESLTIITAWRDDVSPGDLNDDGSYDLEDIVLGLQVCAGLKPQTVLHLLADVNGDRLLGLEEVLFILWSVAIEQTTVR